MGRNTCVIRVAKGAWSIDRAHEVASGVPNGQARGFVDVDTTREAYDTVALEADDGVDLEAVLKADQQVLCWWYDSLDIEEAYAQTGPCYHVEPWVASLAGVLTGRQLLGRLDDCEIGDGRGTAGGSARRLEKVLDALEMPPGADLDAGDAEAILVLLERLARRRLERAVPTGQGWDDGVGEFVLDDGEDGSGD